MTIRELMIRHLTDHGLSDQEADEVLRRYTTSDLVGEGLIGVLDEEASSLFLKTRPIIDFVLDNEVLKWMNEIRPDHQHYDLFVDNVACAMGTPLIRALGKDEGD